MNINNSEDKNCSICGDPLCVKLIHTLECNHIFHYECLLKSYGTYNVDKNRINEGLKETMLSRTVQSLNRSFVQSVNFQFSSLSVVQRLTSRLCLRLTDAFNL